jgi:hypothetical protein
MLCFYYSPHANASTKPENFPFTEAELGAHVLYMCPLLWQDQYNMNKKGMMPMDMRSLLTLLEAIERIYTHEKGKPVTMRNPTSLPTRARKGKSVPVLILQLGFPRKSDLRSIAIYARSMGAHIPLTRLVNVVSKRKTEQTSLVSMPLRKAERKTVQ